ncbi:MAG: sulfotransferase [Actinomycetota bacterium]
MGSAERPSRRARAAEVGRRALRASGRRIVRAAATATASGRRGPDLVVIGTKRGGTTSLFRDLERHPAMLPLVPSARRLPLRENQKGVHYFDTGFGHGDAWYRGHFPMQRTMCRHRRRVGAAFTAEASPYLLFHPLAPARVATAPPDTIGDRTFFVVLLRDPVERTVSHWAEQTRNGVETLGLAAALAAEPDRVGDAHERLADGSLAVSHAHEQQSYAAQSEYAASLGRWFDAVGRERVVVDVSERYYSDPAAVLRRVTDRLGVEPLAEVGRHRNAAPRPSELDADVEASLVARFTPDVRAVEALLGQRLPWPRFSGSIG